MQSLRGRRMGESAFLGFNRNLGISPKVVYVTNYNHGRVVEEDRAHSGE